MAVIKQKGGKEVPALSTSSLPDIIFMILFFFMVSTSMREVELAVQFSAPTATEIVKLEKKSLVSYIYIGQPVRQLQEQLGTAPRIQLNDKYVRTENVAEIGQFIASEREKLNEADRSFMTVCIKADKGTRMGIITDVKQELRRANALKISYAATKTLGY
ncbi:MAG: biopolymer transporter ExbD [Tidjanibacter sp.]|nr:biopolymer transporter ExbD [Tidjanibacter sp.]